MARHSRSSAWHPVRTTAWCFRDGSRFRSRLVRQLLTESAQLAALGGALGLLVAVFLTNLVIRGMPPGFAMIADLLVFRLNPALLGFTLGVSVLCVLVFGLVPALRATRS